MAGTRYKDGIKLPVGGLQVGASGSETPVTPSGADINKILGLAAGLSIPGSRFSFSINLAAADVAKTFYIAPVACKVISAYERHVTVAGQAGTLTIEKLVAGEAPGAGAVVLAAAWDLTSVANTSVSKVGVTTAAGTLAAGNALCFKMAAGAATSYALGTVTILMERI